jgi:hypothetical protein
MERNMPATPRRPLGLQAQLEDAANGDHNRRMAEIQAMAPLLALLDPHMPGLRALGLDLSPDNLGLAHEHIGGRRLKVLRAQTGGLFNDIRRTCEWLEALRALGFAEISRTDSAHYPTALLRRGHLLVRVDVLRTPPAALPKATTGPGPSVRQAINELLPEAAA